MNLLFLKEQKCVPKCVSNYGFSFFIKKHSQAFQIFGQMFLDFNVKSTENSESSAACLCYNMVYPV